ADRPQSAADVLQELDAITSGSIATQARLAPLQRTNRFPRVAIVAIVLLVLAPFAYWLYERRAGGSAANGGELSSVAVLPLVNDGLALWSDTYERQAKDVFQVQDDIARQIASALQLKLGAQAAATVSSSSHGTENLQAYDLYLRGIYFWNARGEDNLRRSISY